MALKVIDTAPVSPRALRTSVVRSLQLDIHIGSAQPIRIGSTVTDLSSIRSDQPPTEPTDISPNPNYCGISTRIQCVILFHTHTVRELRD